MSTKQFPSNDFVLGAEDSPKQKQPKTPEKKQATNPFVLGAEDSQLVKKKDGDAGSSIASSPTVSQSPSPADIGSAVQAFNNKKFTDEDFATLANSDYGKRIGLNTIPKEAVSSYIASVNSDTRKDMVDNVMKSINEFYPDSDEPGKKLARRNIMQGVLLGNQDDIAKVKSNINQSLQKQIDAIDPVSDLSNAFAPGTKYKRTPAQEQKIAELKAKQQSVNKAMDEWGLNQLVNSPEMKPFVDMDANHPQLLTSVAASKIGAEARKRYGLTGDSGNTEYDDAKNGMALIIQDRRMKTASILKNPSTYKSPEAIKEAQRNISEIDRYTNWYNNLDTEQYPDVGASNTARFLGDIIAETKPSKIKNNIGIITAQDVADAAKIAEERNPGWYVKYGKFISTVQEHTALVPHPGLIGAVERGVSSDVVDALKFRADIFGYEKDKDELEGAAKNLQGTSFSGAAPTKVSYDKDAKAYRELKNEYYGRIDFNNAMRMLGENAAGLAAWVLPEMGGAKIAEAAGAGKNISKFIGLVSASAVTGFDANRKTADELIDDNSSMGDAKKNLYATVMTMATAGIFKAIDFSPTKAIESALTKSAGPDLVELLEENNYQKPTTEQMQSFLKDKILPRAQAIAEKVLENTASGVKLGAATVADQKIKDIAGLIVNPDKAQVSSAEDNMKSFGSQVLLMNVIGIPGVVKSAVAPASSIDALYDVGLRAPQYIDQINKMLAGGEIDQEKANAMIASAKTLAQEVAIAQHERNDFDLPLTIKQKKNLVMQNFRKRSAEMLKEKGVEVSADGAEAEIKNIKSENKYQSIEDGKTFQSITEDQTGEKPKSISDIDFTKNYVYNKEGKLVVENGASLIHHLINGNIDETDITPSEGPEGKSATGADTESKIPESQNVPEGENLVDKAVIQIGDKTYEGKNHYEAIEQAKKAGEDVSGIDRERDGKFKTFDGRIITREEAQKEFGASHSHELIEQPIISPKTKVNEIEKSEDQSSGGQEGRGEKSDEEKDDEGLTKYQGGNKAGSIGKDPALLKEKKEPYERKLQKMDERIAQARQEGLEQKAKFEETRKKPIEDNIKLIDKFGLDSMDIISKLRDEGRLETKNCAL